MTVVPLPTPSAEPVSVPEHSTKKYFPNPGKLCFSCDHPNEHPRVWSPDPNGPERNRTLVLCFDGTGDSFDADVSLLWGVLYSEECLNIIVAAVEFKCRPILLDADEGRSIEAARPLSGSPPSVFAQSLQSSPVVVSLELEPTRRVWSRAR
jgi:hypothetical protein